MKKRYVGKRVPKKKKSRVWPAVLVILGLLVLAAAVLWFTGVLPRLHGGNTVALRPQSQPAVQSQPPAEEAPQTAPVEEIPMEVIRVDENASVTEYEDTELPVRAGSLQMGELEIIGMGAYTGIYMEDGSDEVVSGVHMITLKNNGQKDLQYAEVMLRYPDKTASFKVTTLPAGQSAVLLEQERLLFEAFEGEPAAEAANVAWFSETASLHADTFEITGSKGLLQVTNISGADISGEICVYYKNSAADLYYGGITYLARVEGGLKAGQTRDIMTGHYSPEGSKLMFVTYAK